MPRHLRKCTSPDVVARVGNKTYSDLSTAIREGQGRHIDVLQDCIVHESIQIDIAGTTLDLGGNTVLFRRQSKDSEFDTGEQHLPALTVCAPYTFIRNGRVAVLSGAAYCIQVEGRLHKAELCLDEVGLAYEGKGSALQVVSGIAMIQNSRIDSEGSGLFLSGKRSGVAISQSKIAVAACGANVFEGKLLLDNTQIAARESFAIFAESGYVGTYASTIASYSAPAIITSSLRSKDPATLHVCESSEVTSVKLQGIVVGAGSITVVRSMVRSMQSNAIEMGSLQSHYPVDVAVGGCSIVSSWKGTGIDHRSGELCLRHAEIRSFDATRFYSQSACA